MPLMTCGTMLAHLLEAYDVGHVFGIPGVHNVELYRGLWQTKIRHVSPRHEQGAGFMADGYARATGKPGVAFVITGPGLTNIATAMGQAYGDSSPMLVLSSVNRRHEMAFGRGFLHEMPSQRNVSAGMTAFSHTLLRPEELPDVLAAAFAVFSSSRPRPVNIEIPIDVIEQKIEWEPADAKIVRLLPPAPAAAAILAAAEIIAKGKRTLILAGGGAAHAAAEVERLATLLEAPVMMTVNGRGILAPSHPLNADFAIAYDEGRKAIDDADTVIAIGTEIGETDYDFESTKPFQPRGTLIRIDIDPRQIAIGPRVGVGIVADAKLATIALIEAIGAAKGKGKPDRAWADKLVMASAKLMERTREPEDPLYDRMLAAIRDRLGDPVLVGDSTKPVYRGMLTYRAPSPRSFFSAATGFGTLGFALPAAIGAKVALPDRHVIAMLGDGGIQFTLPELMSAKEAEAGIAVVVWNNNGYREIKDFMVQKEIKPMAVDIGPPDFLKTAASVGIEGTRIKSIAELTAALAEHGPKSKEPRLYEIGPWLKD